MLFPAHAGVILCTTCNVQIAYPFPRTRGGDPAVKNLASVQVAFSPHTRG